jgi:cytidylate kinase
MSHVVIISGPPGSGKSSVAESLCERYDRTVHFETDRLYDSIRMGFVKPWLPGSGGQNRMVTRAAARAVTAYVRELYAVFIDAVCGPDLLEIYREELRSAGVPVHFALLMPSEDETVRRALVREETLRVPEDVIRRMHAEFRSYGEFAGITIDNTDMTPDQAADRVMAACGAGQCLVLNPA